MNKKYMLFSDGTWASTTNSSHVKNIIDEHIFPFPMDIKGDSRREVIIISDYQTKIIKTNI